MNAHSPPTPNKYIFKQEPYSNKADLVEITIAALQFLVKSNKFSLATLLTKRILTLKDIFLGSTGTSNLDVDSKEKLSQLLVLWHHVLRDDGCICAEHLVI